MSAVAQTIVNGSSRILLLNGPGRWLSSNRFMPILTMSQLKRTNTLLGVLRSELMLSRRLPARLTAEQAAILLGFAAHEIPMLVTAKLLKPLGKPSQSAVKYFATVDIERLV